MAMVAFIVGATLAAQRTELPAVQRFADDWEGQDFADMYAEVSPETARHYA
jgi:hypothetical protein